MHHSDKDPIIAVATAAGRGGIGILRLSFGKALEAQIVGRLFGENCTLKARYAHLLPFLGTDGGVLDRAIVLLFPAPHSYTGESVLEIQAHGGPVLLSLIMRTCLEKCRDLGLRMAEPGEFTRRAFMNGRMDLTQAEAVADLIDAVSESAVQAAGRSLSGEFSNAVRDVDGNITELRAFIEATLDFPEEDIDVIGSEKVRTRLVQAETGIRAILENARQGQVLREGVTVAIVGSPNVGKSSLLNALAQEEVAIVTDIPGTTRDRIEHWVSLNGVPVKMVDTAGIRTTDDVVESKGIERTLVEIRKADVVLHLKDASGLIRDDTEVLDKVLKEVRHGVQMPQPEFRRLFLRLALSYEKLRRQQHHERVRNVRTEEIFKKAQKQYARCFQGIARLSGNERVQNGASGSDSGKYFKKHEQASRFELKNI